MSSRAGSHLVRRHAVLVLTFLVLGLAAGGAVSALTPRTYESQTQLFVSAPRAANAGGVHERALFAQQRVKSYLTLVSSPLVLTPVITRLGLDTTPGRLASQVSASSPPDTVLVVLTARDASAATAQRIADTAADQFASVVAGLEGEPGNPTSVQLSVVRPAQRSSTPISPKPVRDLMLGGGLGLLAGLGIAALRERMDPRVVTRAEVEHLTGAPVLATITKDRRARRHPLVTSSRSVARLDSFRRLRARLQLEALDGFTLLVTSPSHGDGRTTTVLNLALVLAESGTSVVVVDCDRRRPAVHEYLGLPIGPGVSEVVNREVSLERALTSGPGAISVLRSGQPDGSALTAPLPAAKDLLDLVHKARERADVVLLDCPAVLESSDALQLAWLSNAVLLVVKQGGTGPEQLREAVASLEGVDGVLLGCVLNHATPTGPRPSRRAMQAPAAEPRRKVADAPVAARASWRASGSRAAARHGELSS